MNQSSAVRIEVIDRERSKFVRTNGKGLKSFVLCGSTNSYHWNMELHTGQQAPPSANGSTYDIVIRLLTDRLMNAGYHLFTDNYYTSPVLAKALIAQKTNLTGTLRTNRIGVPTVLKQAKDFERRGQRGDMIYVREDHLLFLQWLDKRVVSILSTCDSATENTDAQRYLKEDGQWELKEIRRPQAVATYNTYMGGIDNFDHLAEGYSVLRRSKKS